MIEPGATTSGTIAPEPKSGGFPPFKTETFSSQLFWLTLTFAFLFVVLWKFAGPRIQNVIADRRSRIAGDIAAAEAHRRESEQALAGYQAALAAARGRAHALAEENRKRIAGEIESAKAAADADAHAATAKAEERIGAMRAEAKGHMIKAAQDAAVQIVARLTGDTVSDADAAAAVSAVGN
jgi:F-type H+-transporting ATPase subunit b